MPEPPSVVRTPDPLAALRAGVAAHRQVIEASQQAGAALQQPAKPAPTSSEEGAQ